MKAVSRLFRDYFERFDQNETQWRFKLGSQEYVIPDPAPMIQLMRTLSQESWRLLDFDADLGQRLIASFAIKSGVERYQSWTHAQGLDQDQLRLRSFRELATEMATFPDYNPVDWNIDLMSDREVWGQRFTGFTIDLQGKFNLVHLQPSKIPDIPVKTLLGYAIMALEEKGYLWIEASTAELTQIAKALAKLLDRVEYDQQWIWQKNREISHHETEQIVAIKPMIHLCYKEPSTQIVPERPVPTTPITSKVPKPVSKPPIKITSKVSPTAPVPALVPVPVPVPVPAPKSITIALKAPPTAPASVVPKTFAVPAPATVPVPTLVPKTIAVPAPVPASVTVPVPAVPVDRYLAVHRVVVPINPNFARISLDSIHPLIEHVLSHPDIGREYTNLRTFVTQLKKENSPLISLIPSDILPVTLPVICRIFSKN